jgi:membrane protein implicated in regulation of membrane protease activity
VRYSSLDRGFQAGSPIASGLVIIVGSLAIAASIVVGFLAFVILGSLILVLAAVLSIRLWWLRRKMARDPASRVQSAERPNGVQQTIEGEYHVIVEEEDGRPR